METLLLRQVHIKLFKIMPKLQMLLEKGELTLIYLINRKDYNLLFHFPYTAISDFMMSVCCHYCLEAEVHLSETMGNALTS